MVEDLFQRTQDQLVDGFRRSVLDVIPQGPFRDFVTRALAPKDPDRPAWLQLFGLPQLARLTLTLFGGIVSGQELERVVAASVTLNVYLTWEVTSDNLCIGLGGAVAGDDTRAERRAVLDAFNAAAVERLSGGSTPVRESLRRVQPEASRISWTRQGLSPDKCGALVKRHVDRYALGSSREIDHSIWSQLVANLETAAMVADHVAHLPVGPLVRWGLIHRYRAVSALLAEPDMPLSRRTVVGADAILVAPVLAYHIGLLPESACPAASLGAAVEDGSIAEVLFGAAFLVRLLNDLGTPLLTGADDRRALFSMLRDEAARQAGACRPLRELLLDCVGRFGAQLTRLNKDISHGELNIALSGVGDRPARESLPGFERRVEHLAMRYTEVRRYFVELSDDVAARLGDGRAVELARRFVHFHEKLYSRPYTSADGEFAV